MKILKNNEIFSKDALDRLRSPEQLDVLLKITNPISWMAIVAICILVFSILLWSIFGVMAVKVNGVGILLDSAGVVNISHNAAGRIKELRISTGSVVEKGDIIAVVEQPEQEGETMLSGYHILLSANGRDTVNNAWQYDNKLYQSEINRFIVSPYDGIVNEIKINKGDMISAGMSICSVRQTQEREDLIGIMYVPLNEGKKIKSGMVVQLAPNGVNTAETGSLMGVVMDVSEFPVSSSGMMKSIGNQEVVNWMLNKVGGGAMEVRIELVKNKKADASEYLWSSIVGNPPPVTAGSICTASVVIERKPPIEKVFYKVSQWLRSR